MCNTNIDHKVKPATEDVVGFFEIYENAIRKD